MIVSIDAIQVLKLRIMNTYYSVLVLLIDYVNDFRPKWKPCYIIQNLCCETPLTVIVVWFSHAQIPSYIIELESRYYITFRFVKKILYYKIQKRFSTITDRRSFQKARSFAIQALTRRHTFWSYAKNTLHTVVQNECCTTNK